MVASLEQLLLGWAGRVPLELFAPLASFIEEVVAPIPSPAVMLATGSLAAVQGYALPGILVLALLGALGKLAGSVVIYLVADRLEDWIAPRMTRLFGITHAQVESFGARLTGTWRDYGILTLIRALPLVPSVLVSAGGGFLKVPLRLFAVSTLAGSFVRDLAYLYVGYAGADAARAALAWSASAEDAFAYLALACIVGVLGYLGIRKWRKTA